ncbi:centrosomal protein of 63 kDa-like isoform X2 [Rhincodon typus]|nr:centrosomal protein of 63 kDa-like isoform X2 [Rhincodon typus]XP_048453547.1 centrosomal protein of 63 kDa-like isoform X2 [Rhincodon typus]XP_048453548.1 centrosomal protein of 63 kDa-like isoform X2 [Rhincodon typus]XP_048453549.1 centrosomal protein of 63 kDa-like isoform X2 [Rhincodon typus]XP_048453550.1 centrosomal protein of 63 kDa-like isoform X2 [Rhincodon typus]XP_048453551.1 centrosomal protein of 63 kDa-like isoform X2 [Rhincodon typus]XP_048453552.1 centrosomal protein of 63 
MEEIIKGLEKNSRLRDSSCEAELHELIHQIDVMVSCKNTEWEQHSQSLETQLEMRELELNNMQTCLEQKHHEVGKLRQQLEDFENFHREMILKYKERLKSFKSDLRKLQSSYEKLQKHQLKQAREPRKLEIIGENGETDSKQKMLNSNLEAQSSDAYWNCRKQIELCESEIKYLKSCMENAQDTIKSDETIIEQLKLTIEQKSTNEELNQKNQQKLSEEIKCYQRRCQKMESEITELQIELQSRDDLLQVTDIEQKQLRRELARAKGSLMRKDRDIRLMKQNSSNMMTGELTNFEMECQSSLKHLWASSKTETLLQTEILRLNAELELSHTYCRQQNDELSRKEEELQRLQNEYVEANKEVNKLRDCLCQEEQLHSSEMVEIRTEISNLTIELDQKEITITTVTEKAAYLEKQLKIELEKTEQILAEYWVAKEQLGSLKAENQQLKKNLQTLEGRIPMIEGYQVKEMQNAYMASISELGYDNKRLQKDLVKLRAELEMSSKTSQEKYEAALRHTQQAVAEMKEHEDRRVKKLRQENEQQMNTMKIKLDETIHHYEGKIRNLQKGYSIQNNLRNSVPGFAGKKNREYSPERKPTSSKLLTANSTSYWHSSDITSVNIPDISPTCIHPEESFLAPNPTEMSDISSVTEHFLKEEEERARVLEKLLNSHVDELQTDSKCTVKMYAGAKVDMPATTALLCNCTFQEI